MRSCTSLTGLLFLLVVLSISNVALAGGPLLVSSNGIPQTWANGQVTYYTDAGDLSSLLPQAQADQFLADAWARWTSVPVAALTVTRAGQLDEDVTGINFNISPDVQPTSTKQVAVIYDKDGSVVDALLGSGAGARDMCATNSVIGQTDRVAEDGHFAHALLILNGNCALEAADLALLRYRLVRAMGRILGLDFSQLNENVVSGVPVPTADDYAGYPLMHALGVLCNELSGCVPNADVPRMDDRAALARLYPANSLVSTTARVRGVVRFPGWNGGIGQGMQGINVAARLVDQTSGRVSRQYGASCVSGFLFRGNAGNPMTGYSNALGGRWDQHGSTDPALEGFYDLAGLEVPDGQNSATYELSVEPVNTLYNGSTAVGPYIDGQVATNASAGSVRVTIGRGSDVVQDFVMQVADPDPWDRWEPSSFAKPRTIPLDGTWKATLSGYGDRDYYGVHLGANRTFTFDVIATNENDFAVTDRMLPVAGIWSPGAPEDAPSLAETFFNTAATATTRLQGVVSTDGDYKIGVADYRGDGRPDFRYRARLFYADKLAPSRVSVQGGSVVTIEGFGFTSGTEVSINGTQVKATQVAANQIVFRAPALSDGLYTVLLTDPETDAQSEMTEALAVGSAGAKISLLNGANPQVPVGTVAPNAMRVHVADILSGDPVPGATVVFAAPSTVSLVGCAASPCKIVTDQSGVASVQLLLNQAGASMVTASLPTGGSVAATVNGLASTLEIALAPTDVYLASGLTLDVPVSATVVVNGIPAPGKTVEFVKNYGPATIESPATVTGSDGVANGILNVQAITSDVNISACVAPVYSPCRTLLIHPVSTTSLALHRVSGDRQVVTVGKPFNPVVLRVTDGGDNPVFGVPITFDVHIFRSQDTIAPAITGEVSSSRGADPVVISSSAVTAVSDASGLVSLAGPVVPSEPIEVRIRGLAGASELDLQLNTIAANVDGTMNGVSTSGMTIPSKATRVQVR